MKRHRGIVATAVAVVVAALVPAAPPTPAGAATAAAVVARFVGGGEYSPGLSLGLGSGSVTIRGVLEGTFTATDGNNTHTDVAALTCAGSGQWDGLIPVDQGSVALECFGGGVLVGTPVHLVCGNSTYVRVGAAMALTARCSLNMYAMVVVSPLTLDLELRFIRHTTAPSTTGFSLEGVAQAANVIR